MIRRTKAPSNLEHVYHMEESTQKHKLISVEGQKNTINASKKMSTAHMHDKTFLHGSYMIIIE